jgi:hypothetical protein
MTVDVYVTTQRRFRLDVHADEQPALLPAAVTLNGRRLLPGSHSKSENSAIRTHMLDLS